MADVRITSRQNRRVKEAVQLRQRKWRVSRNLCLIDGTREICQALAAGVRCPEVFVCDNLCTSPEACQAVKELELLGAEIIHTTPGVFAKLAYGNRAEGLVAVAQLPARNLHDLTLPADPLVLVLEGVEKPGNLGAILRTADGAGVDAIVVADQRTDLFNPNTIRASLGTAFRDNICPATTTEALAWLDEHRMRKFAARPEARVTAFEVDLRGATAILVGSEAEGLSALWSGEDVQTIRLPMRGVADSLNVSTAAGILVYEALRQRKGPCDSTH